MHLARRALPITFLSSLLAAAILLAGTAPDPATRPLSEAAELADISVRDHRALGDGVANDTAAIQAAIDAAARAGGGTVLGSPGTYLVSLRENTPQAGQA